MKPIYEAIASFKGAQNDWRKLPKVKQKWRIKILHSPQSGCNYKSGERAIS
jgi:hypothetical protein